jgi:hypothetical protein
LSRSREEKIQRKETVGFVSLSFSP